MRGRSIHAGLKARAGQASLLALALACGATSAHAAGTDLFSRHGDFATPEGQTFKPSVVNPSVVNPSVLASSNTDDETKPAAPKPAAALDPLSINALFDQPKSDDIDLTAGDPPTAQDGAAHAPPGNDKSAEKGVDPEPDAPVVPPAATPSHDPLDKPKPAVPPVTDAAKNQTKNQPKDATTAPAADAARDLTAKDLAKAPTKDAAPPTQQADQPLPPQNAAIKAALDKREAAPLRGPGITEKRKEREAVAFFYAAHGFAPAWSETGRAGAAVDPVLSRLAKAGDDALTLPAVPKALKTDGTPEEIAESDIALTEAVVAYARQASGSRIDPHAISPLIGAKPDLADPGEVIDALLAAGTEAGDKLQALNPTEPRYVALRDRLAELRGAHAGSTPTPIPPGPTLKIGMRDSRVPLLRVRFNLEASSDADDADLVYDAEVAEAVEAFQRDHGVLPTGRLTPRTIAALGDRAQAKPARQLAPIIANMEMWRWMPHDLGSDRIEVNVPDYKVVVFHDGTAVASNRVVVGKTETPTPLFSNTMKYLIVNPAWNVPQSIIKKEMLPKGGGSLSYLQGRGYEVGSHNGQAYVKQLSGPKNALGRVKFMFPNDYSVYLHDTPSKSLFSTSKRAYSHGCVRVDKPFDFAESVLNDGVPEGGRILWNQTRLEKMLGDKERYVNLPKPLPIHIEYFTVSVDPESGQLTTREDIYGYTAGVVAALGLGGEPAQMADRKPRRTAERTPKRAASVIDDDLDPR